MHGGVVAGSPQGPVEHTEKVWTKPNSQICPGAFYDRHICEGCRCLSDLLAPLNRTKTLLALLNKPSSQAT